MVQHARLSRMHQLSVFTYALQPFADGGARQGDTVHTRKNFLTGPGKKGGYGFNKTTLSERQGYKGVVRPSALVRQFLSWLADGLHCHS